MGQLTAALRPRSSHVVGSMMARPTSLATRETPDLGILNIIRSGVLACRPHEPLSSLVTGAPHTK